ncbi:MBOAT family O-acyltransferase [Butyrivibrio fibrisolvens]|uniref:MBOAT family O-acyltransferase n=1 Tax=Butyrivibrio fibrisolvens TaxID=831 RepID=UPI001A99683F|nr:MBOAT family O-acyltransferase [Butyrivibrio fibrisolvens]
MMDKTKSQKKIILLYSVIFNVGILFVFKYMHTFASGAAGLLGLNNQLIPAIALPLGISFYTFQIMSYIIDLYRGEIHVQRNLFDFALYVSFFPQLVAGPIVKYKDIELQLKERESSWDGVYYGIKRFIFGLGKKVIISNTVASMVDNIFSYDGIQLGWYWYWAGALLYTLQIYYDFSGYSDMAIGLGRIFGFSFMENFNYPYISASITEFWRRWHISLSTWFKEYVYIPLGGNRRGKLRTYINLWIVFLVTGIWHGATLNFWLWGLWHGLFIFIERVFKNKYWEHKFRIIRYIYVGFVVVIGWAMFRCDSLAEAISLLRNMFSFKAGSEQICWYNLLSIRGIVVSVIGVILMGPLQICIPKLKETLYDERFCSVIEFLILVVLLFVSITMLVSGQYNPFIYFKF